MTHVHSMEERIIELESRVAFQEDLLSQLNVHVAEQNMEITKLHTLIQHLNASLKNLRDISNSGAGAGVENQPPPHY